MSNLRIDTEFNIDQEPSAELEILLAQQAEIQARIASLQTSSTPHHRSPIHKQKQHRGSHNVPRSMPSSGATMARNFSAVGTPQRMSVYLSCSNDK
jgi:hypothetical protein